MKYALLIYDRPGAYDELSPQEGEAVFGEYFAITQDPSVYGGAQLQPVATATTVRVDGGRTVTTDGPFAETEQILGGYYLTDADDLAQAIAVAARIPAARLGGAVEVRPIVER
jgi:hypothetical protein